MISVKDFLVAQHGRLGAISPNWPAPNVWVFIAQLVEHCSANAEAMGLNPVEALKNFWGAKICSCFNVITTAMIISSFKFEFSQFTSSSFHS